MLGACPDLPHQKIQRVGNECTPFIAGVNGDASVGTSHSELIRGCPLMTSRSATSRTRQQF